MRGEREGQTSRLHWPQGVGVVLVLLPVLYCAAGKSEFQVSTEHFHPPSACFYRISTFLPVSFFRFPFGSSHASGAEA